MKKTVLLLISLIIFGCAPKDDAQPQPQPSAPSETPQEAHERALRRAQGFVRVNADNLAAYAMKSARSQGLQAELSTLLEQAQTDKAKKTHKNSDNSPLRLMQLDDMRDLYKQREFAPIFVDSDGISPRALALETELERTAMHGLQLDDIPWRETRANVADAHSENEPFHFTQDEEARIAEIIVEKNIDIKSAPAVRKLVASFLTNDSPLPRLRDAVAARTLALTTHQKTLARLELLTTDLAMRFARAIAFENMTHLTAQEEAMLERKKTDVIYKKIAQMRTLHWLQQVARVMDTPLPGLEHEKNIKNADESNNSEDIIPDISDEDDVRATGSAADKADAATAKRAAAMARQTAIESADSIDALVELLYPPHPAYRQLMQAWARYNQMPDWSVKTPARRIMKPGRAYPNVPALRTRLAQEGYYHGEIKNTPDDEIFDDELRAAVRVYYEMHQMAFDPEDGYLKGFWSSLNTPRSERLKQIETNLRRWHQTQLVASPYYIWINIPAFTGEIWKDNQKTYAFDIVVGNAKKACSTTTKEWVYINATPLMHARMLYIEYNPYWNVPPRIEQEDYIEKINADPTWLQTHGFEYFTENGHTMLRQLPSEKNALGRVKFIFPNMYSTFMHDSPQTGLFRYPIRAFSHGCMRVKDPLQLAKRLLQYDGQWYDALETDIDDMQNRRIVLKKRFDVFIDYFTVSASEDGMVYFLADPYRYVRDEINPPSEKSRQCEPNPKTWIARKAVGGDDVSVEVSKIND